MKYFRFGLLSVALLSGAQAQETEHAKPAWSRTDFRIRFPAPPQRATLFPATSTRPLRSPLTPNAADNWISGTGNWSNAGGWTAGIPNSTSAVTIGNTSNGYVTEDLTSAAAASLSLLSGNTLFIAPGKALTLGGTATVATGGQLLVGSADTGAAFLTVGGSLTNGGFMQVGNGSLGGASAVNVTGTYTGTGGRLVLQGGSFVASNVLLNIGGSAPATLTGTYEMEGNVGSATVKWGSGGITQIGDGATQSGLVELRGTNAFAQAGASGGNSALRGLTTIASNGELELDAGASVTTTGALTVNRTGQLYVGENGTGGGTLNLGGSLTNAGYMQVGNSSLGGPSTAKVNGTYTGTGGRVIVQGGSLAGSNAILNITGAAPSILTGTYDVEGHLGSGAVKWGSGGITQIGDGGSNQGIVSISGTNAYVEVGATNSNSALRGLTTIASNGQLELDGGTSLNTTGPLVVNHNGQLFVGEFGTGGGTLNVGGSLTNSSLMEIGNTGSSNASTVKVTGTYAGAGGKVVIQGGSATGSNALLNITGAAPATLTGIYTLQGGLGSAAVKWASGGITQLGDGGSNQGIVSLTGANAYMEVGATNSNSALKGLSTIASNGQLQLDGGALLTTNGGLTVNGNGQLLVGDFGNGGGNLNVSGALKNSGLLQVGNTGLGTVATVNVGTSLTNNTTISAINVYGGNVAAANGILQVTGPTLTNSGTINLLGGIGIAELKLGGNLTLSGTGKINLSNSANNLITGAASSNTLTNSSTVQGSGTLSGIGIVNKGTILANQSVPLLVLPSATGLSNQGTLSVLTGDTMQVGTASGGLTNFSGTTLAGGAYTVGGTLQFGESGSNILSDSANITLTSSSARILNFGGGNMLTNLATVTATGSFTLGTSYGTFTTAGNFTNNGTLSVGAGATFTVNLAHNLTNFSGTTLTGGTYNVTGTLQFKGANIVTNAANITLAGSTAKIVNESSTNALLGFRTNAASGKFALSGNASLTTTGGSFTNAGWFTVAAGSTFKVGGATFNFTQTAGTTTVDGTLANAGAGSFSLNGGSLFGTGTVSYGVVDTGIVSPGDSVAQTGKLAITGTYKQNAGGALNVTIGGTSPGATYDQLNVTGTATLGGSLNISLASGYTPAIGNTFDILNAASITGNFSTITGLAINATEHFTVTTVNGNEIKLTVVAGPVAPSRITQTRFTHVSPVGVVPGRARRELYMRRAFVTLSPALSPKVARAQAPAIHPFAAMNHLHLECGVDVNELLKTSPKRLLKSLWALPDSPNALHLGYAMLTTR